jgi:hypothetical protein
MPARVKTKTEKQQEEHSRPRLKIKLIEILVILAVVAVFIRLLYHIVYWRDTARAFMQATTLEVAIGALFLIAYILQNKWLNRS